MNFGIKYKLLLTFFIAAVSLAGCMLFLIHWSFERGFLQYVNTVEQEVHENLVAALADEYKQQGSWEFLRGDRQRWRELQISSAMKSEAIRERLRQRRQAGVNAPRPPSHGVYDSDHSLPPSREGLGGYSRNVPPESRRWMARGPMRFGARLVLLDQNKHVVIGRMQNPDGLEIRPIRVAGQVVGYLGIRPRKKLSDTHDLRFTQKQGRAFSLIALSMIIISTILILPVARRLVKPINTVTRATRELASGKYSVRIPVRSNDEIGQLSRDFNTLARTLEQNEKARRQWIADISHELRTPLSVLRGEIESLQDGVRSPTQERMASLHSEVMNLNRLIDDLYELSLSDIGALSYRKQRVNLNEILDASLASLKSAFAEKQITINRNEEKEDKDQMMVFADANRLQQLFTNLLTNSLRYTNAGGTLQIVVSARHDKIIIDFKDSSPAVAEEELPHLFERLYRVESSRNRSSGGVGLGLSLCRNIVDAHDGRISARPSPLGGLWIRVELARET